MQSNSNMRQDLIDQVLRLQVRACNKLSRGRPTEMDMSSSCLEQAFLLGEPDWTSGYGCSDCGRVASETSIKPSTANSWFFFADQRSRNQILIRYCPITTVLSVSGSRKRWLGEDSGRKVQEQGWVRAALTFQVLWYLVPFVSFTLSDCTFAGTVCGTAAKGCKPADAGPTKMSFEGSASMTWRRLVRAFTKEWMVG